MYKIIDGTFAHKNMILAQWLRSLRQGNPFVRAIAPDVYYSRYNKYLNDLLASPEVTIKVAVLEEEPDTALGWVVYSGSVLHYIHVQKLVRNQGVAKSLCPASITSAANLTKTGLAILKKTKWTYNPFI